MIIHDWWVVILVLLSLNLLQNIGNVGGLALLFFSKERIVLLFLSSDYNWRYVELAYGWGLLFNYGFIHEQILFKKN
jgi:hypothetical protein